MHTCPQKDKRHVSRANCTREGGGRRPHRHTNGESTLETPRQHQQTTLRTCTHNGTSLSRITGSATGHQLLADADDGASRDHSLGTRPQHTPVQRNTNHTSCAQHKPRRRERIGGMSANSCDALKTKHEICPVLGSRPCFAVLSCKLPTQCKEACLRLPLW